MPEGHSVHRLAAAYRRGFAGQRVRATSPQGRFLEAAEIDGWTFTGAEAVGKHLFLALAPTADVDPAAEPTRFVHVHLGLYGAVTFAGEPGFADASAIGAPRRAARIGEQETPLAPVEDWRERIPRPTTRLRLLGERGLADLVGPTACELLDHDGRQRILGRLGPDPLRSDADPGRFTARVLGTRTPIGALLMDQRVVAGIGNIYRAELLFRARLDPFVPGHDLTRGIVEGLWEDLVPLIAYGRSTGRIVTTQPEHRPTTGGVIPRDESFYVYQRQSLPCRLCGRVVAMAQMAGRAVYWCARCQSTRRRRATWTAQHPAAPWAFALQTGEDPA